MYQPKYRDLSTNNSLCVDIEVKYFCDNIIYHYPTSVPVFFCNYNARNLVWKYGRLSSVPFLKSFISFHSGIFHIPYRNFRSISFSNEELVVQNLRKEPHSSVTVRRFRKLKSCCYIIAIPSGWHRCPNPNCNARF